VRTRCTCPLNDSVPNTSPILADTAISSPLKSCLGNGSLLVLSSPSTLVLAYRRYRPTADINVFIKQRNKCPTIFT